jgi:hypothetical protein
MKKITLSMLILTAFAILSCGNDEGTGQVELAISTEDGIEQFGSIVPGSPNYATAPSWLETLQVLAYNGDPASGVLMMNETFPASALDSGEYLSVDVPAGNNLYFVINAIDRNRVIQYASDTVGPVNIQQNKKIAINVVMRKMVSEPTRDLNLNLTLELKYAYSNNPPMDEVFKSFGTINTNIIIKANIYTLAVKVGDQWVPTNPNDGFDYSPGGWYYYDSVSQWTGGQFLSNSLMFITVHAEDASGGVVFYGVRLYDDRWSYDENPLTIYMRHPSKLVVTLQGANLPASAKVQMYVNDDWKDLYVSGTTTSTFNATTTNPVIVDAPSGEGWFTGAPVQSRCVGVFGGVANGEPWGWAQSVGVDWGGRQVAMTNT